MRLGGTIIIWAARHAAALFLIVLILIAGRYAVPPAADWISSQVAAARSVPVQMSALRRAGEAYDKYAARRGAEADAAAASLVRRSDTELRTRRVEIDAQAAAAREARLNQPELAIAAAGGNAQRIFEHYQAGAEMSLLEQERRIIDALLEQRSGERRLLALSEQRRAAAEQVNSSHARWLAARDRAARLNRRFLADARNDFCRASPIAIGCENYRAMIAAQREMAAAAAANRNARLRIAAIDQATRLIERGAVGLETSRAALEQQRSMLSGRIEALESQAQNNWLLWLKRPIQEVLPTALGILALVIFGPALLKAGLYFLVAPVAAGRPPVRLLPGDRGDVTAGSSRASQQVELAPGQTLLLVPEALQSTPHAAQKWTQWLLSWSMPLSSLASGMAGLVGLRVERPDTTLVSATGGAMAEITLVSVAPGSAMVLRPRALKGLLQEASQPLKITRHWRLLHLSAWLNFQFRYLVFHGPCTLIVEGSRGVRLERACGGRGVNQAATIGFSAGLDYAVSRSEAFGAYLMGRQELFNDSFAGTGCYLYEEFPQEARAGGWWGRGLRGIGDAALKVLGL